jgi:hypothetical protein
MPLARSRTRAKAIQDKAEAMICDLIGNLPTRTITLDKPSKGTHKMNQFELLPIDEPIVDVPRPIAPIFVTPPTFREVMERDHPTPQPKPEPVLEELVSKFNGLKAARAAARAKANETEAVRRAAKKRFDDITLEIRELRTQLGEVVGTDEEPATTTLLKAKRLELADSVDLLEASTTRSATFSRTEADEAAAYARESNAWAAVARVVTERELADIPPTANLVLQRAYLAYGGSADWASWLADVFKSPYAMPKGDQAALKQKVFAEHGVVS